MPVGRYTVSGIYDLKHNFSAVVPPTVNDDKTNEYSVGSIWIDVATDIPYICADNTIGAAVWVDISGGGAGIPSPEPDLTVTNFTTLNTTYPPTAHTGEFAWVLASQGVRLINYKPSGWYYSDGATWSPADLIEDQASYVGADTTGFTYSTNDTVQEVLADLDTGIGTKQNTITGAASTITSSNLTANRALASNASGKVVASAVTDTELSHVSGVTSAIQTQLEGIAATVVVKHQVATNTYGGTFTSGSYQTRPLNVLNNPLSLSWVSLASNQVTLNAGTYHITGVSHCGGVTQNKTRLRNITDASDLVIGINDYTDASNFSMGHISGVFTIADTKVIELQHRCNTTIATSGFGNRFNFGDDEGYAYLVIRKIK